MYRLLGVNGVHCVRDQVVQLFSILGPVAGITGPMLSTACVACCNKRGAHRQTCAQVTFLNWHDAVIVSAIFSDEFQDVPGCAWMRQVRYEPGSSAPQPC
jgi:hypothetical protein